MNYIYFLLCERHGQRHRMLRNERERPEKLRIWWKNKLVEGGYIFSAGCLVLENRTTTDFHLNYLIYMYHVQLACK